MIPQIHGASRSRGPASLSHALHALGSKERPTPRPSEPPAAHDASDNEQRLEQELSQLLSRRPVRNPDHQTSIHTLADIEPDEPPLRTMPFVGPHAPSQNSADGKTVDAESSKRSDTTGDDGSAGEDDAGSYSEASPRFPLDLGRTNWFRTARRARRNRRVRFIGSWLITILVGGFIVSIAAMILFGMPKFAAHEQQAQEHQAQEADAGILATPGRMAVSPTRWHLN